jgi:hypothetical protein
MLESNVNSENPSSVAESEAAKNLLREIEVHKRVTERLKNRGSQAFKLAQEKVAGSMLQKKLEEEKKPTASRKKQESKSQPRKEEVPKKKQAPVRK